MCKHIAEQGHKQLVCHKPCAGGIRYLKKYVQKFNLKLNNYFEELDVDGRIRNCILD